MAHPGGSPQAAATQLPARWRWFHELDRWLPRGSMLPGEAWAARHRALVLLLWVHVPALAAFGLFLGRRPEHVWPWMLVVVALAALATQPRGARRFRSSMASVGLLTCSALAIRFSGGYIEAHFHFFVVVIAISLYQEWVPFLLAIAFVALHNGIVGTDDPSAVFNHAEAILNPWAWALISSAFIFAASIACLANWRISEVHRERQLAAEARLHSVVAKAPVMLFAVDRFGRVAFADGRTEEVLGRPAWQLVGRDVDAAFKRAPSFAEEVRRALRGEAEHASLELQGRDFDVRFWSSEREAPGLTFGVATEVTERRRAEEAERRAQDALVAGLRENDQWKTKLLNNAAHELGTPLTPLLLQMQVLKRAPPESRLAEHRRSLDMLDRNFHRLSRLIEDILDVARLQGGRLLLQPRPTRVTSLVGEVVEAHQGAARRAGVGLEGEVEPGMRVEADRARLLQVLHNLVGNALKFTPPGGTVLVAACSEGGFARVEVRDTGVGIDPADLDKLFQPFGQLHDPAEGQAGGTGLGLYISRGIVELHGGRLWAESAGPGKGSTFAFEVPLLETAQPGPEAAPAEPGAPAGGGEGEPEQAPIR